MTLTSVADLIDMLRERSILQPGQLQLLTPDVEAEYPDARAAVEMMVRRKWLTGYQAEKLIEEESGSLVLGPYVLLEPIGEGGMGQVFKARHKLLDRVVALKQIREDRLNKDPEAVRRFQREARAAAQLSHPNVVMVYDADRAGETWYISMEFVEGVDLSRLVREGGQLPVAQACDFIRQAALGLQHAHDHSMVHRDIKPSNLLVSGLPTQRPKPGRGLSSIGHAPAIPGGRQAVRPGASRANDPAAPPPAPIIKILDMGLVRVAQAEDNRSINQSLTQEGSIVGTPDYIAPEQARNAHKVDIRADLYSLGCTFYYLVTGRPPFIEGSAIEKLLMHQLDDPPRVEELRKEVPKDVAAIIHKLMAKAPKDRFQTPLDLANALSALTVPPPPKSVVVKPLSARSSSAPPSESAKAPEPSNTPVGLAMPPLTPSPHQSAGQATPMLLTPKPATPLRVKLPDSPPAPGDRKKDEQAAEQPIAASMFKWGDAGATGVVQVQDREPAKHIASLKGHNGCIMALAFAPNRDTLASGAVDGTVRMWDFSGTKPRERYQLNRHKDAVHSLAFTQDNTILASGSGSMDGLIWLWNLAEDQPRELAYLQGHQGSVDALAFSRDGRMMASGGNDLTVRLWDVAGRQSRQRTLLKGHLKPIRAVSFAPDGQSLASCGQDYTVRLWNIGRMWSTERAVLAHDGHVNALSFSPDGKTLATACQDQSIRLWDLTLPKPKVRAVLTGHNGIARAVLISSDGSLVVAVSEGRQVIQWEFESGAKLREWLLPKTLNFTFAFTHDGRYLANGSSDGPINVYRVADKRSRQAERVE